MNRTISLERLASATESLEDDAIELLAYIADRLVVGRQQYGMLELDTDERDFDKEALAEDADGLVYRAASAVKALRKARRLIARGEKLRR